MHFLKPFKRVEPLDRARDQLYKAKMELLESLAAKEHYDAQSVSLALTIERLEKYVEEVL